MRAMRRSLGFSLFRFFWTRIKRYMVFEMWGSFSAKKKYNSKILTASEESVRFGFAHVTYLKPLGVTRFVSLRVSLSLSCFLVRRQQRAQAILYSWFHLSLSLSFLFFFSRLFSFSVTLFLFPPLVRSRAPTDSNFNEWMNCVTERQRGVAEMHSACFLHIYDLCIRAYFQ